MNAHRENLIRGIYTPESIHEAAYWKRRESIEKKSFEYELRELEKQEEQRRRTPDIVA